MKSRKARFLALVTSVVAVGALATPAHAQTPVTYEVLTGAPVPGYDFAWDFHMFPDALTAHPGDVLHFDWGSVILFPVDGGEMPFTHFWAADPDDNGFKIDGRAFFPTPAGTDCGLTADNPCVYDGTSLLYPGDQNFENGFFVQIADTLDNATFEVTNLNHTLTVTVDSTAQQSPANDPDMEAHLAAAADETTQVAEQLNSVEFETTATGARIYQAYMGYDTDHISFFEAFPQNLRVRKGDKVEWEFTSVFEPHTASTPPKKAKKFADMAFSGAPVCDPDGDEGTAPDEPADFENPMFCAEGQLAELDLPNKFAKQQGDGKVPTGGDRAADYDTSGLRGGPAGIPRDPYALKFIRKSGDTPFTVMCAIHWDMRTKVAVK